MFRVLFLLVGLGESVGQAVGVQDFALDPSPGEEAPPWVGLASVALQRLKRFPFSVYTSYDH